MNEQQSTPEIEMFPVKSSQIESIGHSGSTLCVKFLRGGVYHYHDVSPEKFKEFREAKSLGAHLGAHIKPHHKFTKI